MKKVLLVSLSLLFLAAVVNATPTRVGSFGASYYLPDNEFDTLNINPAFVLKFKGLEVYDDNSLNLPSDTETRKNYQTSVGPVSTNESSKWVQELSQSMINVDIGVLGSLNENMGFGLLYRPSIYSYTRKETDEPDLASVALSKTVEEWTTESSGVANILGLFGLKVAGMGLGLQAGLNGVEYSETYTKERNSTNIKSEKSAAESTSSTISVGLGGLMNVSDMELGLAVGIDMDSREIRDSGYYNTNDFYFAWEEVTGNNININLSLEKPLSGKTLRVVLINDIGSSSSAVKTEKEDFEKHFGVGTYDLMGKVYKEEVEESSMNIDLYASLIEKMDGNKVSFMGLNLGVGSTSSTREEDDNTTLPSAGQGDEVTTEDSSSSFSLGVAYGIEAPVTSLVILRGGLSSTLYAMNGQEWKETDKWDIKKGAAGTTVREWTYSSSTILQDVGLSAGMGFQVNEKLLIDVGAGAIFGLNIGSSEEKGSQNQYKGSYEYSNERSRTEINLNLAATYKL